MLLYTSFLRAVQPLLSEFMEISETSEFADLQSVYPINFVLEISRVAVLALLGDAFG